MRNTALVACACILCTLFFAGCQSTKDLIRHEYPAKVVNPRAPYLDENIEVINERAEENVNRTADLTAKTARMPLNFWETFTKRFNGVSDANPYGRPEPYYRKDFQKEMLAESMQGVTQPTYVRGARYTKAYRSPFIFKEELERGGTNDMTAVSEAASSLMAKQYLDFQQSLEDDLAQAEKLYADGKYSEALELVDKVMELDTSSQQGRILFEKIIKAREEDKLKRETEMREKVAQNERISQYLSDAKRALDDGNYEEALRIGNKALAVDPAHEKSRELVDMIEMAKFEDELQRSGTSSYEILERLIYQHLMLYQQYSNENLSDLAKKELQKVSILEAYRDKLTVLSE